jgi:hypothetical protein
MHHPEISKIVKILDDYFLIALPNSASTIQGRKSMTGGNEHSLFICRDLKNGRLEIEIKGDENDDNDINITYYQQNSSKSWDNRVDIRSDDFTLEAVQAGIRASVLYDANPPKEEEE